jgi:hypothetical protein
LGDNDPHAIAGVLISCLKELSPPLLHEMRDNIVDIGESKQFMTLVIAISQILMMILMRIFTVLREVSQNCQLLGSKL